jgi:hypothetical protein
LNSWGPVGGSWVVRDQAGPGEAAVDQLGPILDLPELTLHDTFEAGEAGDDEADDAALDQRPDALSRFATVQGEIDSGV